MSTDRRWAGRAFVVVGLVSTLFAACARGNDTQTTSATNGTGGASPATSSDGGSGGGSTSGTGGSAITGEVGSPCNGDADCSAGACTDVGGKKYCVVPCPPDCPKGTYCSIINGDSICIPDLGQECDKCNSIADCGMPTDRCFKAPLGDTFCARDCTTIGLCPNGFTCMDGDTYVGANGSGGGSMDGGVPDAGGDAGNDAGDAGMPKPSAPTKWCVPNSGFSCPCNDQRDGVSHDCHSKNAFGDCAGKETCDGKAGKWAGCTAATPKAEACNGKDDNCNAQVDEGDGDALCSSSGPPPTNSAWTCNAGACALGACNAGWAAYPPGPLMSGCTCPVEVGEPNGSCATAKDAGMVSDAGGSVLMQGTLSADNDVDFWTFTTVDTDEMTTNSYHVSIDVTGPSPNTEFLIDVIRGAACSDVPTGPSTALVSYDWCVDGLGTAGGEQTCGQAENVTHCNDNSSPYFVRVYRKPGAVGTCTPYMITATAKGGDACDFTKTCP
jgi:hypothetical protein